MGGFFPLTLTGSYVEVLRRPLLGRWAMLGVGAATLLRGGVVQHDRRGAVAGSVVRCRHGACYVSLQRTNRRKGGGLNPTAGGAKPRSSKDENINVSLLLIS